MACPECDPTLNPTGPRKGEHHFAIRLGDYPAQVKVFVPGSIGPVPIRNCYEIEVGVGPGRSSKLWLYGDPDGGMPVCDCGRGPAAYIPDGGMPVCDCGRGPAAYIHWEMAQVTREGLVT